MLLEAGPDDMLAAEPGEQDEHQYSLLAHAHDAEMAEPRVI